MAQTRNISASFFGLLAELGNRGVFVALVVLGLVGCILIPVPKPLLDVLLVLNIIFAIILLLRGLALNDPVKLYAFPTMLLFATLLRLSLNVSSTRLILLYGANGESAAGEVIRAFGNLVVQSDFAVGAILFVLIAVVNFLVIAKGSARVAEVAARFILDSLPGKQISIDADLRAGNITKEQASLRREALNQESQFYGAMDGAMKFVQGDAIAGLVIVFINAIGGIAIGMSKGMPVGDAVSSFGILTIGDGLVNIVPSLLMSLAAGVIVTHVSGETKGGSGNAMFAQLVQEPGILFLAGVALLLAGLLPGLPFMPFALVALMLLFSGYALSKSAVLQTPSRSLFGQILSLGRDDESSDESSVQRIGWESKADGLEGLGPHAPQYSVPEALTLEIDPVTLAPFFQSVQKERTDGFSTLLENFRMANERIYRERGILLPELNVRLRNNLGHGEYRVSVREEYVRSGRIEPNFYFIVANVGLLNTLGLGGGKTMRHPVDSRSGTWISKDTTGIDSLRTLGVEILSAADYLVLEVIGSALQVVEEVFGLNEVKMLLASFRESHRALVDEIFERNILSVAEFTELLRRLVRERVSVRDTKLILEGISEFASMHPEPRDRQDWLNDLHGFIRKVLARSIVREAIGTAEKLRVFVFSSEIEEEFRSAVADWESRRERPPVDPNFETQLREHARKMFAPVIERGSLPIVLLCSGDIRPAVQEFFGRQLQGVDWFRTLAYQELDRGASPEAVGVLSL